MLCTLRATRAARAATQRAKILFCSCENNYKSTKAVRTAPTPPGIFVLLDELGLVAKRLEHVANSEPPLVRIISDNPIYAPYERSADEVTIIGRIRWFAREI